jgi:uncharacterized membrane protein
VTDGQADEPRVPLAVPAGAQPSDASPSGPSAAPSPGFSRIELLPNCSLTVPAALFFFGTVALASLTFAMFFVLQGFWPVLPWAGLELALLGWALWASMRRRHWTQTVTVTDRDVEITTRGPEGERRIVFSRHWASVKLRGPQGWHPSRLLVESHGRACEIGGFLTEEERRALHRRLGELIGSRAESPPLGADTGQTAFPAPRADGRVAAGSED